MKRGITEKTFLSRFKKNCIELLETNDLIEVAVHSLDYGSCPFPAICDEHISAGRCEISCPRDMPPERCSVSAQWQRQVAYYWGHRYDKELRYKMMEIVKSLKEG